MSLPGRIVRGVGERLPAALLRPLEGPAAVFFHGVELSISDPDIQSNHHRIEDFYEIALALQTEFEVAPLNVLPEALARPKRHRRTIFLMSDDGYANTLSVAANLLDSLRLPWTLFVSTEHIDSGEWNPMFLAKLFFRHARAGQYNLEGLGPLVLGTGRAESAERGREALRRLPADRARLVIRDMLRVLDQQGLPDLLSQFGSEAFLNWDGVRELAKRGVTIGAHSHWHWPMHEGETTEALTMQAQKPRLRIEAEVGPCRYFAYPFGNLGDVAPRAWRAVRDAGYDFAFTTLSGTLDGSRNPWLLPRYGLGTREPRLSSRLRLLRLGNGRLARWQTRVH